MAKIEYERIIVRQEKWPDASVWLIASPPSPLSICIASDDESIFIEQSAIQHLITALDLFENQLMEADNE